MTAVVEPTTTTVTCAKCQRERAVTHDALRDHVDGFAPLPPCKGCVQDARRLKPKAADTALRAVAGCGPDAHRSDVVVACWGADADTFGLRGHNRDYPDAKRVDTEISHLLRDGYVVKVRPLVYRLTAAGAVKLASLKAKGKK